MLPLINSERWAFQPVIFNGDLHVLNFFAHYELDVDLGWMIGKAVATKCCLLLTRFDSLVQMMEKPVGWARGTLTFNQAYG